MTGEVWTFTDWIALAGLIGTLVMFLWIMYRTEDRNRRGGKGKE